MERINLIEQNRNVKTGIMAVLGGIMIHLTLGNLYSFGNIMTYIASYLRREIDPSVTYSSVVWVMACTTGAQGLFMVLGGLLERRIGPKLTCSLGCSIMSIGVLFTYFSINISLSCVIFTYGFLVGLGISLSYVSPLACGMKWFPHRKGIINGCIVGGFGLGALISTTFQTLYLNPSNVSVGPSGYFEDEAVLSRVPSVFLAMGGIFLCMQIIGCVLLSEPNHPQVAKRQVNLNNHSFPQQLEQLLVEEDSEDDSTPLDGSAPLAPHTERRDFTLSEMVRCRTFYHLWFLYLLLTVIIGYINATYKSFGQTFIRNDYFLSVVGSLAAIFNASGRVFWGKLMDCTSFKFAMSSVSFTLCFLFIALLLTPFSGWPNIMYMLTLWFIFFTFSGTFVLMPTVAEKVFGSKYYTGNYGMFFTSQVFSGVMVASLNHLMLENFGYSGCYMFVAGVALVCLVLTSLLSRGI